MAGVGVKKNSSSENQLKDILVLKGKKGKIFWPLKLKISGFNISNQLSKFYQLEPHAEYQMVCPLGTQEFPYHVVNPTIPGGLLDMLRLDLPWFEKKLASNIILKKWNEDKSLGTDQYFLFKYFPKNAFDTKIPKM